MAEAPLDLAVGQKTVTSVVMSKDWKKIADAMGVPAPLNTAALDSIEAVFRPLVSTIPFETEPAYTLPDS